MPINSALRTLARKFSTRFFYLCQKCKIKLGLTGESTEANDLRAYFVEVGLLRK